MWKQKWICEKISGFKEYKECDISLLSSTTPSQCARIRTAQDRGQAVYWESCRMCGWKEHPHNGILNKNQFCFIQERSKQTLV